MLGRDFDEKEQGQRGKFFDHNQPSLWIFTSLKRKRRAKGFVSLSLAFQACKSLWLKLLLKNNSFMRPTRTE